MVEIFGWFLAGQGNDLGDLLCRERRGTAGTGLIGQQGADGFAQEFGLVLQLVQAGAVRQPAFSPYAYSLLTQAQLLGNRFIGTTFMNFQKDRSALDQSMRGFATVGDDLQKLLLFRGQANRLGRASHSGNPWGCLEDRYYLAYFGGGVLGHAKLTQEISDRKKGLQIAL